MKIIRNNEFDISKSKLDIEKLSAYSTEQIKDSIPLLDKIMEENAVSTFDLITLLRKKYNGSLKDAYHNASIDEFVNSKFNCVFLSRLLKDELQKLGINAHYLSHQARLYALDSGDKKIKEAHVSLIYPALYNEEIIYTIYDPGLKIPIPITFFAKKEHKQELDGNLSVGIEYDSSNLEYPNAIKMYGISPYSYTDFPHLIYQRFNPDYLIDNLGEMLYPMSLKLLTGYKATIFSKDVNKRAYIKLDHIDNSIEYCDYEKGIVKSLDYKDIMRVGRNYLVSELSGICEKLRIDVNEIADDIIFMVDVNDSYMNEIMDEDVLKEYKKIRKR